MKKKIILVFALLFILPLTAKAEPNVNELDTYLEGNIILFSGTTIDSSHAVMCKLLNSQSEEIDILSVEVNNDGTNGAFNGAFMAPEVGNYTVACANYEGGTIVTDDVTVEEMTEFTVTFDTNGGSPIDQVNVNAGQAISRPEDPTKEGKVFGGWYEDDTLTTPFDFSTRITAYITIYAKWNDADVQSQTRLQVIYNDGDAYQVDFDTDDPENQGIMGVPINHSSNYFIDEGREVTLTAIASSGRHFVGWYAVHEEEDANNPGNMIWVEDNLISNEEVYTFTPEGEYINITPKFEDNAIEMFTVTFDTNGGSNIASVDVEAGQPVARPNPNPTNGDKIFVDWFEDNTLTTPFNFNSPITANTTIYAKWEDPEPPAEPGDDQQEETKYNVPDENGNSISFTEEVDHEFNLIIADLSNLTDEQLAAMDPPMDRETYEEIKKSITDATKPYGTLISFLQIEVIDENENSIHEGPFTIKLKLTDEMKKYNTFKLIYVDDDMKLGEVVDLKVEGDYLVGTLPHLSAYALAGSNTDTKTTDNTSKTSSNTTSPKTYDGIITWVITLTISIIGITVLIVSRKKFKKRMIK